MTRDGYIGAAICREDVVKDPSGAHVLVDIGFAVESHPQLIVLREPRLDPVTGEKRADIRLIAASIARMSADALAEILLYLRYERVSSRQIEAGECEIRRLETSGQRTGIEGLRRWNFLIPDLGCPETMDGERLRDS